MKGSPLCGTVVTHEIRAIRVGFGSGGGSSMADCKREAARRLRLLRQSKLVLVAPGAAGSEQENAYVACGRIPAMVAVQTGWVLGSGA